MKEPETTKTAQSGKIVQFKGVDYFVVEVKRTWMTVLSGATPGEKAGGPTPQVASLENSCWQSHCHGLFELPIAA